MTVIMPAAIIGGTPQLLKRTICSGWGNFGAATHCRSTLKPERLVSALYESFVDPAANHISPPNLTDLM